MLQVAAAALEDAAGPAASRRESAPFEPAHFVGLGLDLNTTNFHLRWSSIAAGVAADRWPSADGEPHDGRAGSIAASRIARAFQFGGPSHTVCSEEASATARWSSVFEPFRTASSIARWSAVSIWPAIRVWCCPGR